MDIINKSSQLKIAREFFRDYNTATDVSKILYPNGNFKKSIGTVTRCVDKWTRKKYFEEGFKEIEVKSKRINFKRKIPAIRLNLNPYFEYISDKLKIPISKNTEVLTNKIKFEKERLKIIENELFIARKNLRNHQKLLKRKYGILDLSWRSLDKLKGKILSKTLSLIKKRWDLEKSINSGRKNIKTLKEFLNDELPLAKFNSIDKEIIKKIFDNNLTRNIVCDSDNIFEGITIFLENIFLHTKIFDEGDSSLAEDFVKKFLSKNKGYSNQVSLDNLRSKIMAISKFNGIKYLQLELELQN